MPESKSKTKPQTLPGVLIYQAALLGTASVQEKEPNRVLC